MREEKARPSPHPALECRHRPGGQGTPPDETKARIMMTRLRPFALCGVLAVLLVACGAAPDAPTAPTSLPAGTSAPVVPSEEIAPAGQPGASGNVGRLGGECPIISFTLGTIVVQTNASTTFEGKRCHDLKSGDSAAVEGTRRTENRLLASKVITRR